MNLTRFLLAVSLVASVSSAGAQSKPQYDIYAVRYATLPDFPVAELVAGADPARAQRRIVSTE